MASKNSSNNGFDFFGFGSGSVMNVIENGVKKESMMDKITKAIEQFSFAWGPDR